MPTEEHNSDRPHQGFPQGVLALMPPLKIVAATVGAALLVWGLLFAYVSSPAWAATITVNSTADDPGADGGMHPQGGHNLGQYRHGFGARECVTGSGDDVINIAVTGTVNLTAALPDLSTNIEIVGPGADQLTVTRPDTAEHFRIFTVTGDNRGHHLGDDHLQREWTPRRRRRRHPRQRHPDDHRLHHKRQQSKRGGGICNEGTLRSPTPPSAATRQHGGGGIFNGRHPDGHQLHLIGNSARDSGGGIFSNTYLDRPNDHHHQLHHKRQHRTD